ncbi:hypothetical protein FRC11_009688, partial [Ceratobasidium sp. 423]
LPVGSLTVTVRLFFRRTTARVVLRPILIPARPLKGSVLRKILKAKMTNDWKD